MRNRLLQSLIGISFIVIFAFIIYTVLTPGSDDNETMDISSELDGDMVDLGDEDIALGFIDLPLEVTSQEIKAIQVNLDLEEDGLKSHLVCLPPSYDSSRKKYPIIYFFLGHGSDTGFYQSLFVEAYNRMESGSVEEAILVAVDHYNPLEGSFIYDSPLTGYWETAFIHEVMPFIEDTYRVDDKKEARGIYGHSIGGNSALHIGMTYPELFHAVYVHAPLIIVNDDLELAVKTEVWEMNRIIGSTFAYNPDKEPPYDRPVFNNTAIDGIVREKWLSGLGYLDEKVELYLKRREQLAFIGMELSVNDDRTVIDKGTKYLDQLLTASDVPHVLTIGNGDSLPDADSFMRGLGIIIEYLD